MIMGAINQKPQDRKSVVSGLERELYDDFTEWGADRLERFNVIMVEGNLQSSCVACFARPNGAETLGLAKQATIAALRAE